jgi:hypothetical protein
VGINDLVPRALHLWPNDNSVWKTHLRVNNLIMKSFVKSLQKQLSFKGKLNKQVYAAYELQDYNKMFELLQTLTPIKFL